MLFHTQTSLEAPKGNCWQTCIACILDVSAEALPSQAEVERFPRYMNTLNAYLYKHHDLMYCSLQAYEWQGVLKLYGHHPSGLYMWEGPTIRTPEHGQEHVIVAQGSSMIHDPHPSRAGLTLVKRWGVLGPIPDDTRAWREKILNSEDKDNSMKTELACACPSCQPKAEEKKPDVSSKAGEDLARS